MQKEAQKVQDLVALFGWFKKHLITFIALGLFYIQLDDDTWRIKWQYILAIFFIGTSIQFFKKHWSLGLFALSFLTSAYYVIVWNPGAPDLLTQLILVSLSSQAVLYLFGVNWLMERKVPWPKLFAAFSLLESLVLICQFVFDEMRPPISNLGSSSMGPTLVAATAPFLWDRLPKKGWGIIRGLPILACLLSNSTATFFVLGVVIAMTLIYQMPKKNQYLVIPAVSAASVGGMLFLGHLLQNRELFSTRLRWDFWVTAIKWWWPNALHLIGTGPGSVGYYLPQLVQAQFPGMVPIWMHNDWLQTLFEQGYFGLLSMICVVGTVLYKSWNRPVLFTSVIAVCLAMGAQFLPHFAPSLVILVGLTSMAYNEV